MKLERLLDQIFPSYPCTQRKIVYDKLPPRPIIQGFFVVQGDTLHESEAKHHSVIRQSFTSALENIYAGVYVCLAPFSKYRQLYLSLMSIPTNVLHRLHLEFSMRIGETAQ